jgi:hypothetical protein
VPEAVAINDVDGGSMSNGRYPNPRDSAGRAHPGGRSSCSICDTLRRLEIPGVDLRCSPEREPRKFSITLSLTSGEQRDSL